MWLRAGWTHGRQAVARRRILTTAAVLIGLTLAAKIVAFGKEIAVSYRFGVGELVDAFLIANLAPAFAILVLCRTLGTAFIPSYIRVRERDGAEAGKRFLAAGMFWNVAVLTGMCGRLALVAPGFLPLLAPGPLAFPLFFVLLPTVLLGGLGTLGTAALHAEKRFFSPAAAEMLVPAMPCVFVLFFGPALGIFSLAAGLVAGYVLQTAFLAGVLRSSGLPILPRPAGLDAEMKSMMWQYASLAAAAVFISSSTLIDQSMATTLGSGCVSSINYATKITALFLTAAHFSFIRILFPRFATVAARCEWAELRRSLSQCSKIILIVTIPAAAALAAFSEPLTGLLFERGAFGAADTRTVASLQAIYAMQLPVWILTLLHQQVAAAIGARRLILLSAIVAAASKIVLNYVLMGWIGLPGIALSTVLCLLLSTAVLSIAIRRIIRKQMS